MLLCYFYYLSFFYDLMIAAAKARAQVGTRWQKTNTDFLREKKKQGFYCHHSKKIQITRLKTVEIMASKNLRRKKLQERPGVTMSG